MKWTVDTADVFHVVACSRFVPLSWIHALCSLIVASMDQCMRLSFVCLHRVITPFTLSILDVSASDTAKKKKKSKSAEHLSRILEVFKGLVGDCLLKLFYTADNTVISNQKHESPVNVAAL